MEDSIDKRQLILETAMKLFERFGFEKTSINDIAEAAGIGKGTFYYYFESKEDVFLTIIHEHAEKDLEFVEQQVARCDTIEEKIRVFFNTPFEWINQNIMIYMKFLVENQSIFLTKISRFKKNVRNSKAEFMKKILHDGQRDGTIRKDLDIDRVLELLFHQFVIFGQEMVLCGGTPESVKDLQDDLATILDMILYGILDRKGAA